MAPKNKHHKLYRVSPEDWAYAAGFIDGEGCIGSRITVGREPQVRIAAGQKVPGPIVWLYDKFGGHVRQRKTPYGITWTWTLTSHWAVIDFLINLYPYLIVKKKQADAAYKLLQLKKGDPRVEFLRLELKRLNTKRERIS